MKPMRIKKPIDGEQNKTNTKLDVNQQETNKRLTELLTKVGKRLKAVDARIEMDKLILGNYWQEIPEEDARRKFWTLLGRGDVERAVDPFEKPHPLEHFSPTGVIFYKDWLLGYARALEDAGAAHAANTAEPVKDAPCTPPSLNGTALKKTLRPLNAKSEPKRSS